MPSRKRSRQTVVLASFAACYLPLAPAATTPADSFSWSVPASTTNSLSNNLPRNRIDGDTSWWNDDAGGSDDGNETESSSDDDNNDDHSLTDAPVAFETTSISYSTVPGALWKRKEKDSMKNRDKTSQSDKNSASYQSMQTLDRLQQMLDDTDYITKPTHKPNQRSKFSTSNESLWTSKDRSRYKIQQRKMRDQSVGFPEHLRQHHLHETRHKAPDSSNNSYNPSSPVSNIHKPPPPAPISEDDLSEESDDALGYPLPNLPVYYSDAEGESEVEAPMESNVYGSLPTTTSYMPKDEERQRQYQSGPNSGYYSHSDPQQPYAQQSPPSYIDAQTYAAQNNYQHHPQYYGSDAILHQGYGGVGNHPPNYPTSNSISPGYQPYQPQPQWAPPVAGDHPEERAWQPQMPNVVLQHPQSFLHPVPATSTFPHVVRPHTYTEREQLAMMNRNSSLTGRSMQQISLLFAAGSLACFAAVSPRNLPFDEYRFRILENVRIVSLALVFPAAVMALVYDGAMNNLNDVTNTFFASCSVGYTMAFVSEVIVATLIRLVVFSFLEQRIFDLSPRIPLFILPWVLRENGYRPKRVTLFAADFLTSCIASPVVEEFVKLKVLLWTATLPRNFNWRKKFVTDKNSHVTKTEFMPEQVPRRAGEVDVVNANQHVTQMLAASLGLKMCDSIRRILLYTKPHHESKSFFSFCRGVFPIHELCGTITALGLAKRDLLGVAMPLWKILLPSVVVHGMANFRGMKPVFKWNSSTPWSEMQLYPLGVDSTTSLLHLLKKAYPKLVWLVILSRVFGYCVKNYYMVNRHARKRATTYAGKHAAFSAELATAELLKKK